MRESTGGHSTQSCESMQKISEQLVPRTPRWQSHREASSSDDEGGGDGAKGGCNGGGGGDCIYVKGSGGGGDCTEFGSGGGGGGDRNVPSSSTISS